MNTNAVGYAGPALVVVFIAYRSSFEFDRLNAAICCTPPLGLSFPNSMDIGAVEDIASKLIVVFTSCVAPEVILLLMLVVFVYGEYTSIGPPFIGTQKVWVMPLTSLLSVPQDCNSGYATKTAVNTIAYRVRGCKTTYVLLSTMADRNTLDA